MRSQGLQEGTQLIQWNSVQDQVRIERELSGARSQAREGVQQLVVGRERLITARSRKKQRHSRGGPSERHDWAKSCQTNKVKNPA